MASFTLSILYLRCLSTPPQLNSRHVQDTSFNSLFEMPDLADKVIAMLENKELSILYLRCLQVPPALRRHAGGAFQFSI